MESLKINSIDKLTRNTDYVYLDDSFLIMFPESIMSYELYRQLDLAGIHSIYTDGSFKEDDRREKVADPFRTDDDGTVLTQGQQYLKIKITEYYHTFLKLINKEKVVSQQSFSFEPVNRFVYEEVYVEVKKNPALYLLAIVINIEGFDPYVLLFIKNMLFGIASFETSEQKLISSPTKGLEMCIASLLLDIGILPIIKQLEAGNKPTDINIRNTKIVRVISQITNNILKRSFTPPIILSIVDEVHKCMEDSSFEPSPRIADIVKYSLITNTYTFLTTALPGHNPLLPFQALQIIISNSKKIFAPDYLSEFISSIGYIPPGSYVELQNTTKCFVLKNQPSKLKTPLVQVLLGVDNVPKTSPLVISTEQKEFGIKRVLNKNEISELEPIRLSMF